MYNKRLFSDVFQNQPSFLLGFAQNLANHVLDASSLTSLLLSRNPLVQSCVDVLLENKQAFNTNNWVTTWK